MKTGNLIDICLVNYSDSTIEIDTSDNSDIKIEIDRVTIRMTLTMKSNDTCQEACAI